MPEFTRINNYRIEIDSAIVEVDAASRGASSVILKAASSNSVPVYVGRAENAAGGALSASTGYPLAAGESISLDLTIPTYATDADEALSVYAAADNQYVHVLTLSP